jgi:hypothetical protein
MIVYSYYLVRRVRGLKIVGIMRNYGIYALFSGWAAKATKD